MGFLAGLFGKSNGDEQLNRSVEKVYKGFKPDCVHLVFPGGEEQAKKIVKSIALILHEDSSKYNVARCERILRLFVAIFSRITVGMNDEDKLRFWTKTEESDIVNEANVDKIIQYITLNMKFPDYEVTSIEDDVRLNFLSDYMPSAKDIQSKNKVLTSNHIGDDDYGLTMEKPIYAKMVTGSKEYLSKLRTKDGEELTYSRVGSFEAKGIDGVVDKYDMHLPSGEIYKSVYINMYSKTTSTTPPAGFILVE